MLLEIHARGRGILGLFSLRLHPCPKEMGHPALALRALIWGGDGFVWPGLAVAFHAAWLSAYGRSPLHIVTLRRLEIPRDAARGLGLGLIGSPTGHSPWAFVRSPPETEFRHITYPY